MFIHELLDAKELFLAVSNETNIPAYLVEKDYWIMHTLWGLNRQGFSFELKGGTSLSKGYKILSRFSEDVDIRIEPDPALNVKCGKNHDKPAHIESRGKFFNYLVEKIAIPGMIAKRNHTFDDEKMRNGGIDLIYQSIFDIPGDIKPNILLEVGFDQTSPNEPIEIKSWAYEKAKSVGEKITDNFTTVNGVVA